MPPPELDRAFKQFLAAYDAQGPFPAELNVLVNVPRNGEYALQAAALEIGFRNIVVSLGELGCHNLVELAGGVCGALTGFCDSSTGLQYDAETGEFTES